MYFIPRELTMKNRPKIAIVGGGPSGLTAAIILNNHGFAVDVFEREPSQAHRTQGGSLDLHDDSGQEALRRAGLLDAFRAIARHEDQETRNVDPRTGAPMERVHDSDAADRPEIDRGVLRDLLLSALPGPVMHWDHALSRVEEIDGDRQRLLFTDGSEAVADMVIGADGAWSRVRQAVSTILPEYSGITFLEGWLETPSQAQADYVGHGTLFSFGGPEALFAQRNGLGRICVYAAIQRSRAWIGAETERRDLNQLTGAIYGDWAPQLKDLLAGCDGFVERPIYQLPMTFEWKHRDGILLLGDAAHLMPPVGVGVNLAMLDASDLAMAIVGCADWQEATRKAQADICGRAKPIMQQAIPGFAAWFRQG